MTQRMLWKNWLLAAAIIALVSLGVSAHAGQRPLSDFLSEQEGWCLVTDAQGNLDCAASYYGGPACADGGFAMTFPQGWQDPKTGIIGAVDPLGQLEVNFVTTVNGSVSESSAPGGLAKVDVLIHASNALIRGFEFDANGNTVPLFGHLYFEVAEGAPPTLGDAFVELAFTNTAPGAPLPDINQLNFCPEPGQVAKTLLVHAHASGPLRAGFGVPDGTPGRLELTVTGPIGASTHANPNSKVFNMFPAEHVIIQQTGQ